MKAPKKIRKQILTYLTSEDDEVMRYIIRLNIMVLISQHEAPNIQQVADLYGMSKNTIGKWGQKLNNSKTMDITVLRQGPKSGQTTRMDDTLRDTIKNTLAKPSKKSGY